MSGKLVIRAENISKQYRLGQVGTGTLSHDLKRWWALARGKEDPYLKVGVENDRTQAAKVDYAWALRDIDFNISQGDTVGIIGKNGAGKSTLLKLLSRVTSPTTGKISVKGRIASLLEVGTGFHPELTGRENIYLNGAILGMTKREITSRFEEIVEFSGVRMYVDTPVKRYSSGMYVRLAFGVAAHLQSEILIVDEVLAVGDMEFQKKCLGKMADVAHDGRTVIFVSHNLPAVQTLCNSAIWLERGRLKESGDSKAIIVNYLKKASEADLGAEWIRKEPLPEEYKVKITSLRTVSEILMGEDVVMELTYHIKNTVPYLQIGVQIFDENGFLMTTFYNSDIHVTLPTNQGSNTVRIIIKSPNLLPGNFSVGVKAQYNFSTEKYDNVEDAITFSVAPGDVLGNGMPLYNDRGRIWLHTDFKF